mgnify:CR=1 FL=1
MIEEQGAMIDEVQQKPKRRKQKNRARQHSASEQTIYIGPNLRGLAQYTVFRDAMPVSVARMMENQPAIQQLVVPIGQIGAGTKRMNRTGTIEHKAYNQLRKDVK